MQFDTLAEEAGWRDASDPLRPFRERFYLPDNQIYLDGNSLGLLCRDAEQELLRTLTEWREQAIGGWTDAAPPWFFLAEELSQRIAPLVGAEPESVIVTGSATANLHQLLATLYHPELRRKTILADALAFPSDIYAIDSHLRMRGVAPTRHLTKISSRDGYVLDTAAIIAAMTMDVQLLVLPSVLYVSGQLLDMPAITAAARQRGILLLWDLSHSIGALPHHLDAIDADGAFWCHYKYLNGGPGAVGGLYLNRRHADKRAGMAGWFGSAKERQFEMSHTFNPAVGAGRLQVGTPPILAMAPLLGALRLHHEAGLEAIRAKSLAMTDFLRRSAHALLTEYGVSFAIPEEMEHGGHLTLLHPEARQLSIALRQTGVIPDFRPPDCLRLAPIALYTSFAECLAAIERLQTILQAGAYKSAETERGLVP